MCGLISLFVMIVIGIGAVFGVSTVVTEPVGGARPTAMVITAAPMSAPTNTPAPLLAVPTDTPSGSAFAVGTPTPAPNEIVAICPPVTKSDSDVGAAVVGDVFDDWALTVNAQDDRTQFTWRSDEAFGMAYLELLHFDCGYTRSDIMSYYTDDGWDTILQVYDSYEETAQCGLQGLRLFEFDLVYNGFDYQMRYWIEPVTEQRIGNFSLVFLADDAAQLDEYATLLYPELPSCEES